MNGNRIRELREKARISQVEFGRRTRIAPQNLSAIECGKLAPWPKARRALARVFKAPETELFGGNHD